ncbi:MAG: glycosyltransferase family 1 protein [Rudaea sp.]
MRIAIATETWPPEINGVALTVSRLAHGLVALGHTVELVHPRNNADEASPATAPFDQVLVRGVGLPRYPGLHFGLPAPSLLHRRWRATPPDVLYVATEGPLGFAALGAAKRLGIPTTSGFHTRFDDFARYYGFGFLTPMVLGYLRCFHNRAAATLVPTEELAAFLEDNGFRNVRVLNRGVDVNQFNPGRRDPELRKQWGLSPEDLGVIYVGRIAAEKNLGLLLRTFSAIRQRQPTARLIMVGDGPVRADLVAEHPDVAFVGTRHDEDLARHYASADLFVFPSTSETFGNVTIEAMASGLPVVAYDYGAAREHMRSSDCGVRVEMGNEDAFVAAAVTLASDRTRLQAMGARARAAVAELSQISVNQRFAELLATLLPAGAA